MTNARIDGAMQRLPFSPSAFMRSQRPELYSDTVDRPLYVLDRAMLEFQLETVTTRNEHQIFEIFCRKLCGRALCPNIRPQSGPEGGGDGKVDADTFPVAEAVRDCVYLGNPGQDDKIWAFAFSAKKDWKQKVASDVRGIAGSGRTFDHIYFLTSQPARAADRARIEAELSAVAQTPVRILDRAWIVEEVIDKQRKDLAHDYLGVGTVTSDPMRLGPEDYSRRHRLDAIERALADPESFARIERQMVTEAILAAKLSRSADCPQHETEGRHARAIRLAKRHGTDRQQLEAHHDALWTAFWWFDDADAVNEGYAGLEVRALAADHARNIEFLVQIHQILVNAVVHRMLSVEAAQFNERSDRLEAALERMVLDTHRPNHRLEARTSLAVVRVGRLVVEGHTDRLKEIWHEFGEILDDAEGLAEFDAQRLIRLIEVLAQLAGKDPTYRAVAEKLADFVSRRTSEAEGALILLRQALHLEDEERFDAIRLLGRAARRLAKHEHSEQLIEAHQHLSLAYRGADLLWAARSSALLAAAGLAAEGEEASDLPAGFVPTVSIWAWIALQLRLIPELVLSFRLMRLGFAQIPLDAPSKERVAEGLRELDAAFASNLLNMTEAELALLTHLPDQLGDAGMSLSRIALLYSLGHQAVLENEQNLCDEKDSEALGDFMALLKGQPVSRDLYGPLTTNGRNGTVVETVISGLVISIFAQEYDEAIMLAQAVGASFEAILATALEGSIAPHTERFRVDIVLGEDLEPSVSTDPLTMRSMLTWPRSRSPAEYAAHDSIARALMQLVGEALGAAFVMPDFKLSLEDLFFRGNAHDRVSNVLAGLSCMKRLTGKDVLRLESEGATHYPFQSRPEISVHEFPVASNPIEEGASDVGDGPPRMTRHRKMKVRSVIDLHSWNRAGWTGIVYARFGDQVPPVFALIYRDREAGRRIFERWRERFGEADSNHEISISIIRRLPNLPLSNYAVHITSGMPDDEEMDIGTLHQVMNRVQLMEPDSDTNLDNFLSLWRRFGCFLAAPAVIENGEADIMTDLVILKRDLTVVDAADIGERDLNRIALDFVARREAC